MAQKEFLQGEITERFLNGAEVEDSSDRGPRLAFLTPTVVALILTPSLIGTCFLN